MLHKPFRRLTLFLTEGRSIGRIAVYAVLITGIFFSTNAAAQTDDDAPGDAVALFNLAQDVHEKGDLEGAIKLYKKALSVVPNFPEAEYQCGTAYLSLRRTDDAEKAFRRALELRPDWTLPMTSLGSLLVQKSQYTEAETLLGKAIELDGQNFPAYAALTELRLKTKAPTAALKDLLVRLTEATTKVRPPTSVWSAKAALENALGDRQAAKISLAKALALEPQNQYALVELASIALSDGDSDKANDAVSQLEKIDHDSGSTKLLRARILAAGGKTKEALKLLDTIDPATPGFAEFKAAFDLASNENAADLEKSLDSDPQNPVILGRLCQLYRLDAPAKALDYCRRANAADPTNIDHAIGYGAALVQARQFEQAVSLFNRLIAVAPDNSTVHANLAAALFELKRYTEAKKQYEWLIARQPNLAAAYYLLGITHDQLAEYPDALANYQQFLRLADPVKNQLEIEKVNLRLPILQRQIKSGKGKKSE